MLEIKDLLGFKVDYIENQKLYELSEFPNFPDDTPQSKKIFDELEIVNFLTKKIELPIRVDITERIKDIKYKDIKCFTFNDLFEIIKKDQNLFVNSNTFFKIKLEYEKKICVFTITYYTINENGGSNIIWDIDDLLEITNLHFRKKKFIKKFINNKKIIRQECPNYLEYIPLIPILWLEFNEKNELCKNDYFKMIENNIELPF